ncbi:MAG: ABC1 kinase family protein [Bacillus sp. (in: firmicutes)]
MSKKKQQNNHKTEETTSVRLREIVEVMRRHSIIHGVTPEKLRLILEDLGPTYVKIGQIMSMRSDMLPQKYCNELMKLRADVKPIEFSEVVQLIEEEYGMPIKEVFPEIEEKPLGSASMAQVHIVRLKDGRKAVVKVQRPHIKEIMAQDIALMRKAAKLFEIIELSGDVIDFNSVIEEMWVVSKQEMDFLLEAKNCRELAQLNADIAYIAFPEIIDSLTTSKILVMEYVDGIQIDHVQELTTLGYDMNEIGEKLAENYIKQVLDDGFFHADPHPGNVWIRDGKIVWLDLGMVGRLSNRDRLLFKNAVLAIVNNDIFEVKNVLLSLGTVKGKVNHSLLYDDVEELVTKYANLELGNIDLGQLFEELIDLCNRHSIRTPARITMLARGVVTIEGVLSACCPDVNFMQLAKSHLTEYYMEDFDLAAELKKSGKNLYTMTKKAIDVPGQLSDLLKMATKGQMKMNLDVTGAEEPIKQIDHMLDKLIICLIASSLLIGSSLISTTNMRPQVLDIPLFGILGFCGSAILGCWLLFGILRRWRKGS